MRDRVFPAVSELLDEAGTREDAVRSDDWGARLAELARATRAVIEPEVGATQELMLTIGDRVAERATAEQVAAIRATLGVSPTFYDEDTIAQMLNAWKRENNAFITRFTDEAVQEAQDAVSRGVRSGRSTRDIQADLRKRFGISNRRAERIARTEASQLNAQITRERQRELGIKEFEWLSAADERVRDQHEEWSGRTFAWDNPPDGVMPGEPVNCRCVARASVESLLQELEAQG